MFAKGWEKSRHVVSSYRVSTRLHLDNVYVKCVFVCVRERENFPRTFMGTEGHSYFFFLN